MIALSRRGFLRGATAILAAPAIVRASSLMPVRTFEPIGRVAYYGKLVPIVYGAARVPFGTGGFIVPQEFCGEIVDLLLCRPPVLYRS